MTKFRNWPPPLLWQWMGSGFFELLICMLEDISSSSYGTELKFSQKMLLDVPHKLKVNGLQSEFALQRTSAKKLPTRVPYTKHWPIKRAQKFLSIKTILSHLVSSWKHFCRLPRVWACWPMCFYFDYCSWLNCRNWPPPLLWQWMGSGFFELLICMLEDISSSSYGTELKFSQKMLLDVPHKLKVNGLQSEFALQRTSAKKLADSRSLYETLAYKAVLKSFFQLKPFSATLYPAQNISAVCLGYGHVGQCVFILITVHD